MEKVLGPDIDDQTANTSGEGIRLELLKMKLRFQVDDKEVIARSSAARKDTANFL